MAKYCIKCGAVISNKSVFCPKCGADQMQEVQKESYAPASEPVSQNPQNAAASDLFTIDGQTKETIIASITGLVIAELIIFFGDFLIGRSSWLGIISVLISSAIGGAISGFLIAKFYYPVMDSFRRISNFCFP